jgi:hypothetical protein
MLANQRALIYNGCALLVSLPQTAMSFRNRTSRIITITYTQYTVVH